MESKSLTFGEWLFEELERRDLSQADLARKIDTSTSLVSYWVGGKRRPNSTSSRKIARALGLSDEEVLYHAGHLETLPAPLSRYRVEAGIRDLDKRIQTLAQWLGEGGVVRVPFYGRVPADAVRWIQMTEEGEPVNVLERMLRGRSPKQVFVVEASGDCLRASHGIKSGDMVLCETLPDNQRPRNGAVVLIRVADEYSLKVWHQEGDWIELRDGENRVVHRMPIVDDYVVAGVYFARFGFDD